MKPYSTVIAGLITSATLLLATGVATAASVDINIGVPGVVVQPQPVYVQPRPVYVQQQYENDWRERHLRAVEWRDNPKNHGQVVSAAAHARNDARKDYKHHGGKHHGNHKHGD